MEISPFIIIAILAALIAVTFFIINIRKRKWALSITFAILVLLFVGLSIGHSYPKTKLNSSVPSGAVSWAYAIHAIDVPIIIYDKNMRIADVNEATTNFYMVSRDEMLGKSPSALHVYIEDYITNFKEWTEEQTRRVALGEQGKLNSKTTVPMALSGKHPYGNESWYITTRPIIVDGTNFNVTIFSKSATNP